MLASYFELPFSISLVLTCCMLSIFSINLAKSKVFSISCLTGGFWVSIYEMQQTQKMSALALVQPKINTQPLAPSSPPRSARCALFLVPAPLQISNKNTTRYKKKIVLRVSKGNLGNPATKELAKFL